MKLFPLLLVLVLLSHEASARYRALPLMPARNASASEGNISELGPQSLLTPRSQRSGIGFEFGTVAFSSENAADVLGVQGLFGVRAVYQLPVWERYFFKPSVGYWLRPEKTGSVGVTQNVLEAGLGLHRILTKRNRFLWHLGLNGRVDYLFSRISVGGSSAATPANFRGRLGAATGLKWILGPNVDFTVDFELGTPVQKPMKGYVGLTSGLVFLLN